MNIELQKRIFSSLILIPFSFFVIIKGSVIFVFFLTIIFFISLNEWIKMIKKNDLRIIGIIFLIFSIYSAYFLREKSLIDFILIIILCISTDIGGYTFGKFLRGPKLIKISPNKTYSGMFGSFLFAITFSYLFVNLYEPNLISISNLGFIIFVILISGISQIGDLMISYFKRSSKIKDTGKIFPGHGGMLDRIDGMIFVFPFVYVILSLS